jgi:hypothetical protein
VDADFDLGTETAGRYAVTVGDLCFVAIGEIVNRTFSAAHYELSGLAIINSPAHSEPLRAAVVAEWSKLTLQRHKESVVRDFREPDYEGRRVGACLRLGYYYPEALERVALEALEGPQFDSSELYELSYKGLYAERDPPAEANPRLVYRQARRGHAGSGQPSVPPAQGRWSDEQSEDFRRSAHMRFPTSQTRR